MSDDTLWNERLDEFRALGGVANNVRLGEGAFGRGLFPIDPKHPVDIFIPRYLLIPLENIVFERDELQVAGSSAASPRIRTFIERYEREFSWGPGRAETERFLHMMNELPESLKEFLATQLSLRAFFQPISPPVVQKWFFSTRVIRSFGRDVIMPIVELANHGGAARYDSLKGVSLNGTFDGEVLVRYSEPADPYEMFASWMFAPREDTAFSLPMRGEFGGKQFIIRREFNNEKMPFVPKVVVEDDRILVSHLLLGHKQFPRVPKGAFRKAMESAQLSDIDEAFDVILMLNRQRFLDLLAALDGLELPAVPMLRRLAVNQLAALSYQFGVRTL